MSVETWNNEQVAIAKKCYDYMVRNGLSVGTILTDEQTEFTCLLVEYPKFPNCALYFYNYGDRTIDVGFKFKVLSLDENPTIHDIAFVCRYYSKSGRCRRTFKSR